RSTPRWIPSPDSRPTTSSGISFPHTRSLDACHSSPSNYGSGPDPAVARRVSRAADPARLCGVLVLSSRLSATQTIPTRPTRLGRVDMARTHIRVRRQLSLLSVRVSDVHPVRRRAPGASVRRRAGPRRDALADRSLGDAAVLRHRARPAARALALAG